MDLSLNDLRYFEVVAETRNISRAAERLGISQPALSVALKKLETALGVDLFIRSRSGIQLTHAGERMLVGASGFQKDWKRLTETVVRGEKVVSGPYSIGCHPSVALYSLPQLLRPLLEKYPVEVTLMHDLSRRVTESVISNRVDFGIVVNPWDHQELVIRPLWKDTVTLFSSKRPSILQKMDGSSVLICDPDLLQTQSILKRLSNLASAFQRVIHSSNLEVITALVASGAGIGILPGRVVALHHDLVAVDGPRFEDSIALVYRADRQSSKASRALAKEIEGFLKTGASSNNTKYNKSCLHIPGTYI